LDVLVNAAASFSATIEQQLEMLHSDPSLAGLAEKTIDYAVVISYSSNFANSIIGKIRTIRRSARPL
jgi:hypothetical protein